jgi:ABC-type nitrate/sulfonate/bicarbonate transport system substrate-binding protein
MLTRGIWLGGLASAAVITSAVRADAQAETLTIGMNAPSSAAWPLLIAQQLGYFKRYGVAVEPAILSSTAAAAQQAIVGAVDLGVVSSSQLIEAVQGGAPLKLYCNQLATAPYAMIAQKGIRRYADLKGKTIVVGGVNDATRIFAELMIASDGLKPADYDEIYAGATADRFAALQSGSVAAAILLPPVEFRALDAGFVLLGSLPSVLPVFPYTGFVGRADLAEKRPAALTAFAKGYLRAVHWLNDPANAAPAVDILAAGTNATPADARRTYDEVVVRAKCFPNDGRLAPKSLQIVLDTLLQLGVVKAPAPAMDALIDNRFVSLAGAQLAREKA